MPARKSVREMLEYRSTSLAAQLHRAQVTGRKNIRARVAAGEHISHDELWTTARSRSILYSQLERSLREELEWKAKHDH